MTQYRNYCIPSKVDTRRQPSAKGGTEASIFPANQVPAYCHHISYQAGQRRQSDGNISLVALKIIRTLDSLPIARGDIAKLMARDQRLVQAQAAAMFQYGQRLGRIPKSSYRPILTCLALAAPLSVPLPNQEKRVV